MNMKKRTLAAITTVTLLSFSLGGPMFAAGNTFKDINNINGKEKIISLKNQGLIKGVSESQFLPNSKVTTAQGIQFISGGLQLSLAAIDFSKAPVASELFPKVKDKAWYAEAFINAHYNHVELPKNIDPATIITKEQYTHYLIQAIEAVGNLPMIKIDPVAITDEASLNPTYQGSIQRALKYKIISLDSNGKFNPKSELTRADAAIMLYNALEFMKTGQ